MGLFDGIMGNASEVNTDQVQKDFANILTSSENVEKAYKLIRDMFILQIKDLY